MAGTGVNAGCARRRAANWSGRGLALAAVLSLSACGPEWLAGSGDESCALPATDAWRPGCATLHNLTRLLERPADLRRPRRESPRDAARRDAAIATYRNDSGQSAPAKGEEQRP